MGRRRPPIFRRDSADSVGNGKLVDACGCLVSRGRLGRCVGKNPAQDVCRVAPLRNPRNVVTIEGESLAIILLATADIVIKGLGEISIASREVAGILDKGGFSNNDVAPMGPEDVCVVVTHGSLLRDHLSFGGTGFLLKSLKLILVSSISWVSGPAARTTR